MKILNDQPPSPLQKIEKVKKIKNATKTMKKNLRESYGIFLWQWLQVPP